MYSHQYMKVKSKTKTLNKNVYNVRVNPFGQVIGRSMLLDNTKVRLWKYCNYWFKWRSMFLNGKIYITK